MFFSDGDETGEKEFAVFHGQDKKSVGRVEMHIVQVERALEIKSIIAKKRAKQIQDDKGLVESSSAKHLVTLAQMSQSAKLIDIPLCRKGLHEVFF